MKKQKRTMTDAEVDQNIKVLLTIRYKLIEAVSRIDKELNNFGKNK
jgi:hypothetical protein